jgi:uncharacterized protein (DUF885 family)
MTVDEIIGHCLRVIDEATAEMSRYNLWLPRKNNPLRDLPDVSERSVSRRSALGRDLLARIDALDLDPLPDALGLTVRVVRRYAATWSREADWWWIVCDPLGLGFYSLFLPTAYSGAFVLTEIHKLLRGFRFEAEGDLNRYLALLEDYARLVDQFHDRTRGQAERGIRIPQAQFDRVVDLFTALRAAAPGALAVDAARTKELHGSKAFEASAERIVQGPIAAAFDRLLDGLSSEYRAAAPDAVGMSQYPGGAAVYEELVALNTTLPLTAADVHRRGHERMERIVAEKRALATAAGYSGVAEFEASIDADPRWRAETPEAVKALFQQYIDRIAPFLPTVFDTLPTAAVTAAALPAEVSGSMTFGYYGQPSEEQPDGTYFFNAVHLTRRPLANVAALTYHELNPGHHLHVATQLENSSLPEVRRTALFNAFNEGWAEYAATLAGELGMYSDPVERYGRLMMDAFLTCRLVVDTGMNAFGWDLERARDYLREHSGVSEGEIQSETIRYSCDIPAQSLAYKLGDDYFVQLREEMRARLGERFDIRDFHAAAVEGGSLPLPLVADAVRRMEPRDRSASR